MLRRCLYLLALLSALSLGLSVTAAGRLLLSCRLSCRVSRRRTEVCGVGRHVGPDEQVRRAVVEWVEDVDDVCAGIVQISARHGHHGHHGRQRRGHRKALYRNAY